MTLRERIRAKAEWEGRKAVRRLSSLVGLAVYEPSFEHRPFLDELTEYAESATPVRDKRPTTIEPDGRDLTITLEGLKDVLGGARFRGARILEVGPKYGIHSLWLDRTLEPAELVFCDFASDRGLHEEWRHELQCPHRFVYSDLRQAHELLELEPFDLVLFLGVLYHTVYHIPLLAMLNRVTRLGGHMLLETTFDPRPDSSVRLRWHNKSGKAKAVPTIDAVRVMLAWAGWRKVVRHADYRPSSSEALFLCEKTDELVPGSDFCSVVTPHRTLDTCPS